MDGADFDDLLTGELSALVRWQSCMPCPCTVETGAADRSCRVCGGAGRVYDEPSDEFRAGIVAQDARSKMAIAQTMGPGYVGDSVLVVPCSALCYGKLSDGDRVLDLKVHDKRRIIVIPGVRLALPVGFRSLSAWVKATDGLSLVAVAPPVPDENRRISVAVPTSLTFMAPRTYEVVKELGRVRSFGCGLPQKWGLKLLDMSTR